MKLIEKIASRLCGFYCNVHKEYWDFDIEYEKGHYSCKKCYEYLKGKYNA